MEKCHLLWFLKIVYRYIYIYCIYIYIYSIYLYIIIYTIIYMYTHCIEYIYAIYIYISVNIYICILIYTQHLNTAYCSTSKEPPSTLRHLSQVSMLSVLNQSLFCQMTREDVPTFEDSRVIYIHIYIYFYIWKHTFRVGVPSPLQTRIHKYMD